MTTFLLDYAWAQIPAQAAKDAGYVAAIRYLGGTARLTPVERDNLHAAGLGILLVWETAADEAEHPERGARDAVNADAEADALGYPLDCPLFFADDNNDPDVGAELGYFAGVAANCRRPWGVYSGGNVVRAVMEVHDAAYGWMVETWFPNAGANPHLIQLANSHEPYIAGVAPDQYDSNTLERPIKWWGGSGGTTEPPAQVGEPSMIYKSTDDGKTSYYRDARGYLLSIPDALAYAYVLAGVKVVDLVSVYAALAFNNETKVQLTKLGDPV